MFVAGDEVGRTQHGNNNAYCQDSELSWFDWDARRRERRPLPVLQEHDRVCGAGTRACAGDSFLTGGHNRRGLEDIRWHGLELDRAEWENPGSRVLAFTLAGEEPLEPDLHVMMNMDDAASRFRRAGR